MTSELKHMLKTKEGPSFQTLSNALSLGQSFNPNIAHGEKFYRTCTVIFKN